MTHLVILQRMLLLATGATDFLFFLITELNAVGIHIIFVPNKWLFVVFVIF